MHRSLPRVRCAPTCAAILLLLVGATSLIGCRGSKTSNDAQGDASPSDSNATSMRSPAEALEQAIAYLMDQQGDDGGWHSPAYGALKPGAAVTALVLYALSQAPEDMTDSFHDDLVRGADFLRPGIEQNGYVSNQDGTADYSNYATAMLLLADYHLDLDISDAHRQRMLDYLMRAQIGESHGYAEQDVDYGGWDLSGWMTGTRRTAGTNISVTSFAVEAIALQGEASDARDASLRRAERWLEGCQNEFADGGFFFHPEREHHGNKAGWEDEQRQLTYSYGTSTADGLRILNVLDVSFDDPRIVAARDWLDTHPRVEIVPGFEHLEQSTGWEHGLKFYYLFSLSTVIDQLNDGERAVKVVDELVSIQKQDGRFENDNGRMREDDSVIATSFAIVALSNCFE